LNVNGDLGIVDKKELNQNSIANRVSNLASNQNGLVFMFLFRTWIIQQTNTGWCWVTHGSFFIGSGSALSNIISDNSRAVDFHLGLKSQFIKRKQKLQK
jgi:hypothetical protein